MPLTTRTFDYRYGDVVMDGWLATTASAQTARPTVLIAHAWAGRGDHEQQRAAELAELGYTAVAIDVYGKGVRGTNKEENRALMTPLLEDRALLQGRLLAALDAAREQPEVQRDRVAGIGFCFGGLCVLDLARAGAEVLGVASFHGIFKRPDNIAANTRINAKVLALHGYDDPMAPPEDMQGLAEELSRAGADWQIHAYGHTQHSFAVPGADDAAMGIRHDPAAERRSMQALRNFLEELFA